MKKANLPTTENAVIIIFHFLADMISRILRFLFDKNPAIHRARRKRKLSKVQKEILVEQSDFYKQLNQRYQRFFEHRYLPLFKPMSLLVEMDIRSTKKPRC